MDLLIEFDRSAGIPLHLQLTKQLRQAIESGRLPSGTRLPSTRSLAGTLAVSRNVVVTAYDELLLQGYVEGRHGSGTYVTADLSVGTESVPSQPRREPRWLRGMEPPDSTGNIDQTMIEFRTGKSSVEPLSASVWRSIWREVANEVPPNDYGPPAGDPVLREEIAHYLGWARGVRCSAEDVIVSTGAVQAIDLIARATIASSDPVAFEEPGPPPARNVLVARGADIIAVPVDEDGLRVEQLPAGADAPPLVYVTPSHQYPLGGRLPVGRRLALLAWARASDSLIIEDDYDSEFRFDAPPLPALAGLDGGNGPERVAYVGSFSKVLTPAMRVGYLVAPPPLRERIEALKPLTDYHTPWPVQRALAAFIAGGHLERHIRRMRRHYGDKRAILRRTLEPVAHLVRFLGLDAGLHVCLELCRDLDPDEIAASARSQGVLITPLTTCYLGPPDRRGLVLGYGGLTHAELSQGAKVLAAAITQEAALRHPSSTE